MKIYFGFLFSISLSWFPLHIQAQENLPISVDFFSLKENYLLENPEVKAQITEGFNEMYNFQFEYAESQFRWLKTHYPHHPLPYFLLGMNQWWQIVPQIENTSFDEKFYSYMDSAIYMAKKILKKDKKNSEAHFFLAASYGFKARIFSERREWTQAIINGKNAISYMNICLDAKDLDIEMFFALGLYNYYAEWIPENYPALKIIVWFFKKGTKEKGIENLEKAIKYAFYTRIESYYHLIRIYSFEEKNLDRALYLCRYIHTKFPNNSYFHRFYARLLYVKGKWNELEKVCFDILECIKEKKIGYEENSGRYASFYLASIYKSSDPQMAKKYYLKTVFFSEKIKKNTSGYYLYSLKNLAQMENKNKKIIYYCDKILKNAERKSSVYKSARKMKKMAKK